MVLEQNLGETEVPYSIISSEIGGDFFEMQSEFNMDVGPDPDAAEMWEDMLKGFEESVKQDIMDGRYGEQVTKDFVVFLKQKGEQKIKALTELLD